MNSANHLPMAFQTCSTKRDGDSIGCYGSIPRPDQLYHQVADDRDHKNFRLPQEETVDYGWGPGSYARGLSADGKPQGLKQYKSESDGIANLAGRYAAAMALGYQIWKDDPRLAPFAAQLSASRHRSVCTRQGEGGRAAGEFVRCALSLCGNHLGGRHGMGGRGTLSRHGRSAVPRGCQTLRQACRHHVLDGSGNSRPLPVLSLHEHWPFSPVRSSRSGPAGHTRRLLSRGKSNNVSQPATKIPIASASRSSGAQTI